MKEYVNYVVMVVVAFAAVWLKDRYDRRDKREAKDATVEGQYLDKIDRHMDRLEKAARDSADAAEKALAAATEAQARVTEAQGIAAAAQVAALQATSRADVADADRRRIQGELEILKEQIVALKLANVELQTQMAGLIGGAIGLNPRKPMAAQIETPGEEG